MPSTPDDDPAAAEHRSVRLARVLAFESDAEYLVTTHLDLLTQMETQWTAVYESMKRIQRLRGAAYRMGAELSDVQRGVTLTGLAAEYHHICEQFDIESHCCTRMQACIDGMRARLVVMIHVATTPIHVK